MTPLAAPQAKRTGYSESCKHCPDGRAWPIRWVMGLPSEIACPAAFSLAAAATYAATPLAIALATRTSFFDRPLGYKAHHAPTPYLGGAAVLCGFLISALTFGGAATTYGLITACAIGLWAIGTLDDRRTVAPRWRVFASIAAAALLIEGGLGWSVSSVPIIDDALTLAWVLAVVNAFNLMDNLDGAAATAAAASSAGVAILALAEGRPTLACFALAISGASLGFLPWNLAGPARIFLGDGGSMVIGFLVASATMVLSQHGGADASALPTGLLLVGLPAFDVALVVYSRQRRGVSVISGGRDHLTHRLLVALRSPRVVSLALAVGQVVLIGLAIGSHEIAGGAVWPVAAVCIVVALGLIPVLESLPSAPTNGAGPSPSQEGGVSARTEMATSRAP
jgi:UDP-GlcNAc:undecaprenyl-phosphate GlcNAc-1-phosphate transferase